MAIVLIAITALSTGCRLAIPRDGEIPMADVQYDVPRELAKSVMPQYRIEPPDILTINAILHVSEASYAMHVGDTVLLNVVGAFPDEPIDGVYPIETGGVIHLGYSYGKVEIGGLTASQAQEAVELHLRQHIRDPQVTLALRDITGVQPVQGEHVVGPDGRVQLGQYGTVPVVGLTVEEAQDLLEQHLLTFFDNVEVSVSVFAFNSKHYFVVTQGAGLGDQVVQMPHMGNETVMNAISQVNGLSHVSSTRMWIARPGRNDLGHTQILPVDWMGISQRGETETNYQLMPGDRLYIAQDRMIAFDSMLGKLAAPAERIFGFTLLGTGAVSQLSGKVLENGRFGIVSGF